MEALTPVNLSVFCDMLKVLIQYENEAEKNKNKNKNQSQKTALKVLKIDKKNEGAFHKLEDVILDFFSLKSLDELSEQFNSLSKEGFFHKCFEKLSDEGRLEIVNRLPLLIEDYDITTLKKIVENLKTSNGYERSLDEFIKNTLCILTLLGVISFSCDSFENSFTSERKYLENEGLGEKSHLDILLLLLTCAEIVKYPYQEHLLVVNSFNEGYYYSLSIRYINILNEKVYRASLEAQDKTQKIYSKILEIVGLLIAVFSIIGINCFTLATQSTISVTNILIINCSVMLCIITIFYLIHNILQKNIIGKLLIGFLIAFLILIFVLKVNLNI